MVDFVAFPPEAHAYFEAAQGRGTWASVFTPQAMVRDVDRDIRGQEAIAAWARAEVDGGVYQILAYQPKEGGVWILVEFHPAGWHGFLAEYEFEFQNGKISRAVLSYSPPVEQRWRNIPLPVRRAFEDKGMEALPPPQLVVPRVGGLRLEWTEPVPRVREFRVRGSTWEELR